jgi:hypothetical protein
MVSLVTLAFALASRSGTISPLDVPAPRLRPHHRGGKMLLARH